MHRQPTLKLLERYQSRWKNWQEAAGAPFDPGEEEPVLRRFAAFIAATPDCCERHARPGHLTGSALVVSPDLSQVVLTLHRKLGKWLQLGGHADGHPHLHEVAMREAVEESGLCALRFLRYEDEVAAGPSALAPLPFDLDAHAIPARPSESAHIHFDVRFLIIADPSVPLVISEESKDLRWFDVAAARKLTKERSMERQFDKLSWLKERLTASGKALG